MSNLMTDLIQKNDNFHEWYSIQCRQFTWRTMDGKYLKIEEMDTVHVFNSMKMTFNHIAEVHGLKPIWFKNKYDGYIEFSTEVPKEMLTQFMFFVSTIELRGDLPERYISPYMQILKQLGINDNRIGVRKDNVSNWLKY